MSEHAVSSTLGRRQFLALGSLFALSPWLEDLAWAEQVAAAAASAAPMSVGYVAGSDTFVNLRKLPRRIRRLDAPAPGQEPTAAPLEIVPAASLPLGDTDLVGRSLRVKIHGLFPPDALTRKRRRELPREVHLDVLFPTPDPAVLPNRLPFFAWSLRRAPWSCSPPVSFVLPFDWESLPQLAVKVVSAAGVSTAYHAGFTLDTESGRPRLRRGLYLLGLSSGAWRRSVELPEMAKGAPAELFSILLSIEPEPEPETETAEP